MPIKITREKPPIEKPLPVKHVLASGDFYGISIGKRPGKGNIAVRYGDIKTCSMNVPGCAFELEPGEVREFAQALLDLVNE